LKERTNRNGERSFTNFVYLQDPMTIYKPPGSPYFYYGFYLERRRYQASTHLRNETIAHRVECLTKAELAQRRAGILQESGFSEYCLG